jgi:hypothetical protein
MRSSGGLAPWGGLTLAGALLELDDVLRLGSFLALDYFKLHFLVFRQSPETLTLDGTMMHEDIRAILPGDKSESFGIVEPLYSSSFLHE